MDRTRATQDASAIAELLKAEYVFPDVAVTMADALEARADDGAFDAIDDVKSYAAALTAQLHAVHHDQHLVVVPRRKSGTRPTPEERLQRQRERNFGFRTTSVMDGGIGYLKIDSMTDTTYTGAGDAAVAALQFVAGTRAVIFDLRENLGGSATMVQLLMSYLLDGDPVHINSFYLRKTDSIRQFWTLPYVPGRRLPGVPVFALTSPTTFSGAEEFAYDLKVLNRGTIVGETTAGGANPSTRHQVSDELDAMIPFGYPINPVTQTNWEGVGVEPDVRCDQADALDFALDLIKTRG